MLGTRRIGAIFYLVANLDRTEAFYRDAVGLSVSRTKGEHGDPDWLTAPTAAASTSCSFKANRGPATVRSRSST